MAVSNSSKKAGSSKKADSFNKAGASCSKDIWIISNARYAGSGLLPIGDGIEAHSGVWYQISDIARYLLSPDPIEIRKWLVGCKIQYHKPTFAAVKERVRNRLSGKHRADPGEPRGASEELLVPSREPLPALADKTLKAHFNRIEGLLSPYSTISRKLSGLELTRVQDIVGICDDATRERTLLHLKGSLEDKINYVTKNINQEVDVLLESAYIAKDLFEMRGFDFPSYDPGRCYRMIRFVREGKKKACVLGDNDEIQFWIEDAKLIRYLQLLEQSVQENGKLKDAFRACAEGDAQPYRLFFNREMEIDYSQASPPEIYREVFKTCRLADEEKNAVINSLSNHQIGISFSYAPRAEPGARRLYTCLSVMHNVHALESIKEDFPQLYSEIKRRAAVCEAGRFYLLDSVGGYQNA